MKSDHRRIWDGIYNSSTAVKLPCKVGAIVFLTLPVFTCHSAESVAFFRVKNWV